MATDPNNPEILIRVPNEVEASAIVTALNGRGIQATTTGSYTAGFRAEAPGSVHVVVRRQDLDRARQILAEMEQDRSSRE